MSTIRTILMLIAQVWAVTLTLILSIIILGPVVLIAFPFKQKHRLRIINPCWKLFSLAVLKLIWMAKLYREDHRPEEFKKFPIQNLYICNHQSMLDIPTLLTLFQIPPIMKKEVLYLPLFGQMAWASGTIVVDRKNKDSRKIVFERCKNRLLHEKLAVQYYPEGTRSTLGEVKPFSDIKKPLMEFAFDQNIPVIPCSIFGTNKLFSSNNSISFGKPVGVKIWAPVFPKDFENKEAFCHACWEKVQVGHRELKEKLS